MSSPIRVAVCDDSFGFATITSSWIKADERFAHVGTAHTGDELLELASGEEMDAVLLDLVLPDVPNPAALVRELRERRPGVKVLLVSSLSPDELERAAGAVSADAWCHKALTKEDLAASLVRIAG